jgi:hypothetical protein
MVVFRWMMTTAKRALFQEPRPGKMSGWLYYVLAGVGVSVGCLIMVDGLFFSDFSVVGGATWSPTWFLLGLIFTLRFSAELLPKGWIVLAGWLRVGSLLAGVTGLLLIFLF